MTTPTSPLAEKALQRLHQLAEGNGVTADAITLYSADENTYTFEGTTTLLPLFESRSARYAGTVRTSNARVLGNTSELQSEINRLKQDFESKPTWINEAIAQLKEQPAGGWGLDDVRVSLPQQSVVLATSEICPTCQGNRNLTCQQCNANGVIVCTHCQGQRQEICPICLGSGQNPQQPGQTCLNCQGIRYSACRFCHGNGQLTCPTCHGKRGTTCSACNGAGVFTHETQISCGVRTQFKIKPDGLPSGLRRGLDRLGVANLVKGHADIETLAAIPDEDSEPAPSPKEPKKEAPPKPEIHYLATMPYADLRMNFAGKKVIVGVFGKKNVLLGVPPFLDHALEPFRKNLKLAASGSGSLEDALQARMMKDSLKLQLAGNGKVNELRRIYPLGLTPQTATEILGNMRLAINKMTLRTRSLVATASTLAGSSIFAGIFLTDLHNQITASMKLPVGLTVDVGILAMVLTACWFTLSAAIRMVLQKRFPDYKIPVTQKTGKTGYAMLVALVIAFVAIALLAPNQPQWLQILR